MDRVFTKSKMQLSSLRIPKRDVEAMIEAARLEGLSRSEFLRRSVVERTKRVIRKSQTLGAN
jgi:uncharacterized protein (DUF1778 family)